MARTLQCADSNSLAFVILSEAKDLPLPGAASANSQNLVILSEVRR